MLSKTISYPTIMFTNDDLIVQEMICIREGPLICALFEIQLTFRFRWADGLEISGHSN